MRISDLSSYVCSSDLFHLAIIDLVRLFNKFEVFPDVHRFVFVSHDTLLFEITRTLKTWPRYMVPPGWRCGRLWAAPPFRNYFLARSDEHTSELQSLMRSSYALFCLNKKPHIATSTIPEPTASSKPLD